MIRLFGPVGSGGPNVARLVLSARVDLVQVDPVGDHDTPSRGQAESPLGVGERERRAPGDRGRRPEAPAQRPPQDARRLEDVRVVHHRLTLERDDQRKPGEPGQGGGVDPVGTEADDVERVGTEGVDGVPQREQGTRADGGGTVEGRPLDGGQGHREAPDDQVVAHLDGLRLGVVPMGRPHLHLVASVDQGQGQMARQLLDAAQGRRIGAREQGDPGHDGAPGRPATVPGRDGTPEGGGSSAWMSGGMWVSGSQGMLGFSHGCTAASVAPVGIGAIWLQSPTPGDQ